MAKKILIIDDDRLVRKSVAIMLQMSGYEVLEAKDGQAGASIMFAERPDLVVTDVRMLDIDGTMILDHLRQDEWGRHVPVVVLANDEYAGIDRSLPSAGSVIYISKASSTPEVLSGHIAKVLGSSF